MKNLVYLIIIFTWIFTSCEKEKDIVVYKLTTTVSPAEGGSISPSSGFYDSGEQITLLANPAMDFVFKNWTGYSTGTTNPLTITLNSDIQLTAVFEKLDTDQDGVTDDIDQCPNTPEGERVDETGCTLSPIYLDSNGISIRAREWAQVSDTGVINEITYTVIDNQTLDANDYTTIDFTKVVTTLITDMRFLFDETPFNGDISHWDVSNVTDMEGMFSKSSFNQDISAWDVSSVTNMSYMFGESPFNQNLGDWSVENVTDCESFSANTPQWVLPKPNFTNCTE